MKNGLAYETITATINGLNVQAAKGTTILQAGEAAGIYIPTACGQLAMGDLEFCLCAVYVEGQRELPRACQTTVEEGMIVYTETPRVWSWRRRKLRSVSNIYQSPCLECQRVYACDSTVCGRKNIPAGRRCSTCDDMERCTLRKAARYIQGERVIYHRLGSPGVP
jgi:predicted molibdopterin-dependent oxidoreductase YjgC